MKLTIRRSTIEDWYVIERAEHDGRVWVEQVSPGEARLYSSARFSDADVEGSGAEMLAIVTGIESRKTISFKRCAVDFNVPAGRAFFHSPRNSTLTGECSLAEADALAIEIRKVCGGFPGFGGAPPADVPVSRPLARALDASPGAPPGAAVSDDELAAMARTIANYAPCPSWADGQHFFEVIHRDADGTHHIGRAWGGVVVSKQCLCGVEVKFVPPSPRT